MTKEQILKEVIKKAVGNGFETYPFLGVSSSVGTNSMNGNVDWKSAIDNLNNIVFSHSFAKAFWGESIIDIILHDSKDFTELVIGWKYHLQQMVLEPKPLDYLKKFLNSDKSVISPRLPVEFRGPDPNSMLIKM